MRISLCTWRRNTSIHLHVLGAHLYCARFLPIAVALLVGLLLPCVTFAMGLLARWHIKAFPVTKILFASVDALHMEAKTSESIFLDKDDLNATTNLGIRFGVELEAFVHGIKLRRVQN